jgi:hypothetical protein
MSVFATFNQNVFSQTIGDFIEDVRPRLQVVPGRSSRLTLSSYFVVLGGILVVAFGFSAVLSSFASQNAYREQLLSNEIADARLEMQTLQQQLTVMTAPATLHKHALKLGMVPMASPVFLRLEDGAILGKPVPAEAVSKTKTQVPTIDVEGLALTSSGAALAPAQQPVDDSAVLVSRKSAE